MRQLLNNEIVSAIFYISGMVLCVAIACVGVWGLITSVKDLMDELSWRHTYKHRFDKPPTADCYCKDCTMHHESGKCDLPGMERYTPDNGFCYECEPKSRLMAEKGLDFTWAADQTTKSAATSPPTTSTPDAEASSTKARSGRGR